MFSQVVFALFLALAIYFFSRNAGKIRRNILLGRKEKLNDRRFFRWGMMARVALGQSRMVRRNVLAGILHVVVYAGFVLINIEVLEIIIDGLFGTHRFFEESFGFLYLLAIGFFELLAAGVILSCMLFLGRRYVTRLRRLNLPELDGWPRRDATYILLIEIVLMTALLVMNAADVDFQERYNMPVSGFIYPWFSAFPAIVLQGLERFAWWAHWVGILLFLNYIPFSKHFHILLAFPNTWYTPLGPPGGLENLDSVGAEVRLMLNPSEAPPEGYVPPTQFGVRDVQHLSWKSLMDAYSCTECGRCTAACPAHQTGKKLSPRKVMMDTRDRLEEVGRGIDRSGMDFNDGKDLHSYISKEELWACTTCNACVDACPVNINPMRIIYEMRQYLVMEKSEAPAELNQMFANVENNGAPWQFPPMDRANWVKE